MATEKGPAAPDDFSPLSDFERKLQQRLFGIDLAGIPSEFWAAVKKQMEQDGPRLLFSQLEGAPTTRHLGRKTQAEFDALVGPTDGDMVSVLVDATNDVVWEFVYRSTGPYWLFVGGAPLYAEVTTAETTTSATFVALATAGPAIALPKAGDYMVEIGALAQHTGGFAGMSYDIGGTGAVDADMAQITTSGTEHASIARVRRKTGLTAVTLTAKYRTSGATATFSNRWMAVTPVRWNV